MSIATSLTNIANKIASLDTLRDALAGYLSSKGQTASTSDTLNTLVPLVNNLKPASYVDGSTIDQWSDHRKITNDTSVTPSGTYATSTYYNTTFGVKVGYVQGGNIIIAMQAGTSTSYETLYFNLSSAPAGVTITEAHTTSSSYVTGSAGLVYACIISGLSVSAALAISMNTINSTYDYAQVDITLTAT